MKFKLSYNEKRTAVRLEEFEGTIEELKTLYFALTDTKKWIKSIKGGYMSLFRR